MPDPAARECSKAIEEAALRRLWRSFLHLQRLRDTGKEAFDGRQAVCQVVDAFGNQLIDL